MKVKVTAELTIGYGGAYHAPGSEFDIDAQDLPRIGDLVAIILKTPEPTVKPAGEPAGELEVIDVQELTLAEIKVILDQHGIEYSKRARRAELLALIPE